MTLRLPGSLVNRALRSRLLSAQQYRAANQAHQSLHQCIVLHNVRAASSGRPPKWDKPRPERDERLQRFDKHGQKHFQNKQGKRRIYEDKSSMTMKHTLMAIASGSNNTRYDPENEIAESEALDGKAAENDGTVNDNLRSGASEGQASQNGASGADDAGDEVAGTGTSQAPVEAGIKIKPKIVNEELKWLQDPRKLGDRVARILHSGEPALAAAIVRAATKQGLRSDVAWNHLLQYCMDQQSPHAAFKFYNDVSTSALASKYLVLTTTDEKTRPKT